MAKHQGFLDSRKALSTDFPVTWRPSFWEGSGMTGPTWPRTAVRCSTRLRMPSFAPDDPDNWPRIYTDLHG